MEELREKRRKKNKTHLTFRTGMQETPVGECDDDLLLLTVIWCA